MTSFVWINWGFGEGFEIPVSPLTVIIFLAAVILLVLLIHAVLLSKKDFVCPNCSCRFKRKWYKLLVTGHCNNDVTVGCPECGEKTTRAVDRK